MIRIFYRNLRSKELEKPKSFKKGSWVHAENINDTDRGFLISKFGLDEGLLRDAEDLNEVPRMEVEDGITYIYARFPYGDTGQVQTAPVLFAFDDHFVLTLSSLALPAIDKFLDGKIEFTTTQRSKLLLQLFMQINSSYILNLNSISRKVRALGSQLGTESISNRDIAQLIKFENVLNDFLSALIPTSNILQTLLSGKSSLPLYDDDKDLIEDLLLSNGQLVEMIKVNLRTIVNIRESYSTIMTNNLNQIVKVLTALTIVITIPTMISSIYGMNVPLPFQKDPLAFYFIMAAIIILSVITIYIFIKKRWL
jgi:magnesium transporter